MSSARERFVQYVRGVAGSRPVVSPFLPKPELVRDTLRHLGMPASGDPVADEIELARALDYEPMSMTDCSGLIFPWREDERQSDEVTTVSVLPTPLGLWTRRISKRLGVWGDESGFPVESEADHEWLCAVCGAIDERKADIRCYFREWRQRVGEGGVIVIGHPHITWLGYQISQRNLILHHHDYPVAFKRSMEAICRATYAVFEIAMDEGIDFMSESTYGLEMISPTQFEDEDLPYTRRLADWTHDRGGLFWYHNCGRTSDLIRSGLSDRLGADVIETIAPPPPGDNELSESRRHLDPSICSKGNLSLHLLRDGSVNEVVKATREMVTGVQGYAHVHSTSDAVFAETPVENYLAFLRTAREEADRLS